MMKCLHFAISCHDKFLTMIMGWKSYVDYLLWYSTWPQFRLNAQTARAWQRQTFIITATVLSSVASQHQSAVEPFLDQFDLEMPSDNNKPHRDHHHHQHKVSSSSKETPLPPPRELILASPDLILTSKSRCSLEILKTYFECLGPKRILLDNKRTT